MIRITIPKEVEKVRVYKMSYGWRIILSDKFDNGLDNVELEKE